MKIHTDKLLYQVGDRVTTNKYNMPVGTIMGYVYWPTTYCMVTGEPLRAFYLVVDDDGFEREIMETCITGVFND